MSSSRPSAGRERERLGRGDRAVVAARAHGGVHALAALVAAQEQVAGELAVEAQARGAGERRAAAVERAAEAAHLVAHHGRRSGT